MAGKPNRSGRPRKPTRLKIIQGTDQPCRMNPREPEPELGIPDYSRGLSDRGKEYWDEIGFQLHQIGVLTKADKYLMMLLVDALIDFEDSSEQLKNESKVTIGENKKGNPTMIINTYHYLKKDAWNRIVIALREFGLTPSSRTRVISLGVPAKENKWSSL
jgi:P27 family predicted phage terminase small subunit